MRRSPPELWGLSDVARELGVSRQAVSDYVRHRTIPRPDFQMPGPRGGPLWRPSKLEDWIEDRRQKMADRVLRQGG